MYAPEEVGKPGRCPRDVFTGRICQVKHECSMDYECSGSKICCQDSCGSYCTFPEGRGLIESEVFGGRTSSGGIIRNSGGLLTKGRAGIARSAVDGHLLDELSLGTSVGRHGGDILDTTHGLSRAALGGGELIKKVMNSGLSDGVGESRIVGVSGVGPLSGDGRITGRHLGSSIRLGVDSLDTLGGIIGGSGSRRLGVLGIRTVGGSKFDNGYSG